MQNNNNNQQVPKTNTISNKLLRLKTLFRDIITHPIFVYKDKNEKRHLGTQNDPNQHTILKKLRINFKIQQEI